MTQEEFKEIVKQEIDDMVDSLEVKGIEYGGSGEEGDRLRNFKGAIGISTAETPEEVLWNFVTKQLESLRQMIVDLREGKSHPIAMWREKTRDVRNYLGPLLMALIYERYAMRKTHLGFFLRQEKEGNNV